MAKSKRQKQRDPQEKFKKLYKPLKPCAKKASPFKLTEMFENLPELNQPVDVEQKKKPEIQRPKSRNGRTRHLKKQVEKFKAVLSYKPFKENAFESIKKHLIAKREENKN